MKSNIIGVGIFRFPSIVAGALQHEPAIIAVWIAGGVISLFGALVLLLLSTCGCMAGFQGPCPRKGFESETAMSAENMSPTRHDHDSDSDDGGRAPRSGDGDDEDREGGGDLYDDDDEGGEKSIRVCMEPPPPPPPLNPM